jgi:hypothetical protein
MVHHNLLPYFSRPLATPKGETGEEMMRCDDSDGSATEVAITEMPTVVSGTDALNACAAGVMQDVADWMTPFHMDLGSGEGQFGMDSFNTLAQEIGLAQWPAI